MNNNDYLSHHGILGQKWGLRRYQNLDGTLTEAGKKHYQRQYNAAVKKRDRLNQNAEKARSKATKAAAHTPSRLLRVTDIGASVYDKKMRKIYAKNAEAARAEMKAKRWMKKMEKKFSKIPLSEIKN